MLASQRLMKKLKLKEGRKAIITFQDREGNLVSGAFKVTGVYSTNNAPFDESNVFVNLAGVDSMAGVRGQLHEIAVLLKSGNALETIHAKLKQQYPQAEVLNWREIAPEISLTVEFGDQMVYIFMAIILLALAFGILNTMMMSVLERTRELGMLLALGMNRRRVFLMILLETCLLVFAACPPGVVLGLATTAITQHTGIDFSQYSDVYAEFGYSEILYPALNMQQFGNILAMVVLTAVLSGLLPARRALRLKPAESIRKQ
jgi:ABC-type lipoprotein release transport system permease subunit